MADKKTETKDVSKATIVKKTPIKSAAKPAAKSVKETQPATKPTATKRVVKKAVEAKAPVKKVAEVKKPEVKKVAEVKKPAVKKVAEVKKPAVKKVVETKTPEVKKPEVKKVVETKAPEVKKPEVKKVVETKAPEVKKPEVKKEPKSLVKKVVSSVKQKIAPDKETKAAKPVSDKKSILPKKKSDEKETKVDVVKEEVKKPEFVAKLPTQLFTSEKIYEQAIFDTILSDRASRRQGTHQVKNRAQVSGTGKKPWAQKGTGRARTGSLRTPVFVGGGRAFGPQSERNYTLKVNKKVRRAAFVSALTMLANDKAVAIEDIKLEKISTKGLVEKLTQLKVNKLRRVLIVTEDATVFKSASNVPNVATSKAYSLSVELLLAADVMIISKKSLELLEGKSK